MTLSHETLENYFRTNFQLMENHSYSLLDLESMVPWEREIYNTLLIQHIEEQEAKNKQ